MLNIYKASAGSGKTFTLALIYIDLIIDDFNKYSHILAVTFTNKSTAEMKSRIIKNLYTISNPAAEGHAKMLDAQKRYRAEHKKPMVNDIEIIKSCQNALVLLLNNYSQFNVFTIDKFVQKIIRSFAFENRLSADYKVNIDTDQTKSDMVDRLMSNMETDHSLQEWLTRLMNERMEEGSGWNIEGLLEPIAESLLNGRDLQTVSRKELEESRQKNREIQKRLYEPIIESLEELIEYAQRTDLQAEQLYYTTKNPVWSILKRLYENKDIAALLKKTEELTTIADYVEKALNKDKIFKKGDADELIGILKKAHQAFEANGSAIITIELLDKKFYTSGIINDLKQNLSEIEHEQHMQVIGGANQLLKNLIGNAPIPFIYEKAGSRFDNIMIDEFQDTSKMQWENFKPLIENSLDTNNQCLLVGDVKQAIYRWRNSDWKLLSETVYNELSRYIKDETLGTNWRSSKDVIEFNNDIFPVLVRNSINYVSSLLDDDEASLKVLNVISDIYANGQQKLPSNGEIADGYVQINILNGGKAANVDNAIEGYKNQQMLETIEKLVEQGYKYSDICILIRNNKEAPEIVAFLNANGVNVLSNQSLFVCESQSIKAIMSLLSLVVSDDDEPSLAHIIAFLNTTSIDQLYEAWNGELKEETKQKIKQLRGLGLLELVYQAIDMLPSDVRERDYIFLEAFIEKARSFVDGQAASPKEFINYIETHKKTFVIQAPEGQNAVNITSIHKSKGLEFPIILIPNANWDLFINNSNMWCDVNDDELTPLNEIELPFAKLSKTKYKDQYYDEATQAIVDNINLLYVAFTRAKDGLFIWSKLQENKNGSKKSLLSIQMSDLIKCAFDEETIIRYKGEDGEEMQRSVILSTNKEVKELTIEEGDETMRLEITRYNRGDISSLNKSYQGDNQEPKGYLPAVSFGGDIKKRINQTKDETEESEEENKTELGTAKHKIMQEVEKAEDLDKAIKRAIVNGEIKEDEAEDLKQWFNVGQNDATIRSWFDGTQRVLNESTILCAMGNGGENRTDRVMISPEGEVTIVDYKFAQKKESHIKQVRKYMSLVRQCGFQKVKGYLWYSSDKEAVSVSI
ncbi:MAG: UvrD-helicase domain-containing protein [Bacteroidales bacterium]|nr:UvrD-helicase domain-containing protein [Bacteroidales bacterium]